MDFLKAVLYFPERLVWRGFGLIGGALCLFLPFLISVWAGGDLPMNLTKERVSAQSQAPLSFQLMEPKKAFSIPLPDLSQELDCFFAPSRPGKEAGRSQLFLRSKKGGQCKKVALPCRLDLVYENRDQLTFASQESPFWVDLEQETGQIVHGQLCLKTDPSQPHCEKSFTLQIQESPLQTVEELPEGSPFKLLTEAKWLGADLVRARYGEARRGGQRLEWGGAEEGRLEIQASEWLVWKNGKWMSAPAAEETSPIAHLLSEQEKGLVLEGWDGNEYAKVSLAAAPLTPLKIKGEELFSAIRVRSDKQISCMLEKQCLILKVGDWVVKTKGRWKILRKKEDRDAFLNGKWTGELVVFEGIELKQGQKVILGRFFAANRSQMVPIEVTVQPRKLTSGAKPK